METMHTACPVHMASAEKIADASLSAKTHSPSRSELPKQASYVKQVPAKISGGLVWGCPQVTPPLSPLSPLLFSPQRSGQERAALYGSFLRRTNRISLSSNFLRPGIPTLILFWPAPSSWDEVNRVNRTCPVRATPPLHHPFLHLYCLNVVAAGHKRQFKVKWY